MSIVQEILSHKSLIRELVVKDLKIRYGRPQLGFFWAFLSPFLIVVIYYIVFSIILKLKIEEAPFFLYLMSAVFSWRFFQDSLVSSTTSLMDNKNLIKESSFPHYLIPLSIVLANFIVFLPSLFILIAISLFLLKGLPLFIMFLPIVLSIQLCVALSLSVMLSILYVVWRDIKYILEVILLLLFYLTPAFYSIYLVKESFAPLLFKIYIFNPFVIILNLYRITIFKGFYNFIDKDIRVLNLVIFPACFALIILVSSFYLYLKKRDKINDYLSA